MFEFEFDKSLSCNDAVLATLVTLVNIQEMTWCLNQSMRSSRKNNDAFAVEMSQETSLKNYSMM